MKGINCLRYIEKTTTVGLNCRILPAAPCRSTDEKLKTVSVNGIPFSNRQTKNRYTKKPMKNVRILPRQRGLYFTTQKVKNLPQWGFLT